MDSTLEPSGILFDAYVADPKLVSDKPKKKINGRPIMVCNNLNDFD